MMPWYGWLTCGCVALPAMWMFMVCFVIWVTCREEKPNVK